LFSDTHFHLQHLADGHIDLTQTFLALAARNCAFALDIGTKSDDLPRRISLAEQVFREIEDSQTAEKCRRMLHFSGGIWPAKEAILDRNAQVAALQSHLTVALSVRRPLCALGECGLDHHWNPAGVDLRSEDDFDSAILRGEAELFEMQLDLARTLELPVIVHSRDAFEGTLGCIKNIGWHRGVIHCFSYGIEEARSFLDLGWRISFSGSITYTKKTRLDDMKRLLAFIPQDRLLLETDAPYLAPVPFRGQVNTPILVEQVYRFAAELLNLEIEALSALIDRNARELFL
jgi:TatD DNase family protein